MAATLKCTKLVVERDAQDSPTPHRVTCYAADTVVPGVGNVSAAIQASNTTIETVSSLQAAINLQFTAQALPTVDWTK